MEESRVQAACGILNLASKNTQTRETGMKRLLNLIGMTAGGWLGWALGANISFFTAFMVSMVGVGLGLYAAILITKRLLP